MKTAIAINCVILALLVTSGMVKGGSTTVREYEVSNIEGDGGFMYVEYISGTPCRTWGVGVWDDTEVPINQTQQAENIEKHKDTMESTSPRWELAIGYWFELEVGIEAGSDKGESSGTPIGMVWGDLVGADGYSLEKDLAWDDDKTGYDVFSYQAIGAFPRSPVNWFRMLRQNTTGNYVIHHTGIDWRKTVNTQSVEFYTDSYTVGHMRYFSDGQTGSVWFDVNAGQKGASGDLPGSVFGWDDSGPAPQLVSFWNID